MSGPCRVRVQVVRGPLAPYAAGFASELAGRGYSPSAVRLRLWLLDHVSCWLEGEGLAPGELTPERAAQFLDARRAAGYATWVSARSMTLLLDYLRGVRVVPAPVPEPAQGPIAELLEDYCSYLVSERGLAERTVTDYTRVAELFLTQVSADGLNLAQLHAADVTGFVTRECAERGWRQPSIWSRRCGRCCATCTWRASPRRR